ncbi:metal-dependent hydrolase [Burkholderiaceae bacterium FT117]|uniref:metal-dependent hydrolase n=1 Tax=Zeimonas sediminis TaxID=2944268 RepID=UPI002342D185|nr:metal-dependent hydrolase [Zeimonas sediminis]MCM5569510.1 metal-dependent hydrolase [Zeimonas sediminis]
MDSLSQIALGAAVGVAAMGRRTAPWKAALWGGLCGTLPDLDALIDHGDAVSNMTLHRAETHALFWLSLASPLIAWLIAAASGERDRFGRWWLAVWLVLVTHPLLDAMTIYGTQLALPFSDWPFGVGSVFIIDPMYTLPLLIGLAVALARPGPARLRANLIGLALSTAYLCWSVLAQTIVEDRVRGALAAAGDPAAREVPMLVTPTAFNTVLWRVVVMRGERYDEGFVSLLDGDRAPRFTRFDRGLALLGQVGDLPAVDRMARFTHGFWRLAEREGRIVLTDLRMGQEPYYAFAFAVAELSPNPGLRAVVPVNVGGRRGMDVGASLRWLVDRALGADRLPPGFPGAPAR